MRKLSDEQIQQIKSCLENNYSIRETAKKLNISTKLVQKYKNELNLNISVNIGGRPSILSERDKRICSRLITVGGSKTSVEVEQRLNNKYQIKASKYSNRKNC